MKQLLLLLVLAFAFMKNASAQTNTITGKIIDSDNMEALAGVSVMIKGTTEGTTSDDKGGFKIETKQSLPVTLIVSSSEFTTQEVLFSNSDNAIIKLENITSIQNPIVIGGTRYPTKIMNSPVTVQKISRQMIINSPESGYGLIRSVKGVDEVVSSMTFHTPITRGSAGSGSTRVNQLVDGMDNQAPGLNFFVGNFVGLTELDVQSIELLPGASSALYGPGGMNGTILISSRNPFTDQGLSIQIKQGIMHVDKKQRGNSSSLSDYTFRYAQALGKKFAFKIGGEYITAKDWLANDSSNYKRSGNNGKLTSGFRSTDPNYDGINVYGDETSVNLQKFYPGFPGPVFVSRTGYNEIDMIDPETKNIKLSGAVHYKLTKNLEAQLMGYWATGNSVYTGDNRYALKGIKIGQYKFELNNKNWFIRSYTTQEDAGEAYSATVTAQLMNEAWKKSFDPNNIPGSWYYQYLQNYLGALGSGENQASAHLKARAAADHGRPLPGSPKFKEIFDKVSSTPIPEGGRFLEKSQLWMNEGQYNFTGKIKFADILVGASTKKYILDSKGTLFIDTAGSIKINEVGAYAQVTKKLSNFLTMSVSGRYDKNEDFKGHFTPRITGLIEIAKNNNIRLSYQTAYRFPSTQQKYIRLNVGDYILLGGLPWIMDYMQNPVCEIINGVPASTAYLYTEFKPEQVRSFEIGYKSLIKNRLLIDGYTYLANYQDYLGRNTVIDKTNGKIYSTVINSPTKVKTYGFGLGFDYSMKNNFSSFFNIYSDVIKDVPTGFRAYFNTPKYRVNAGIANSGLGKSKSVGFNVTMRWQDAFTSDGEFANGEVSAFTTIDAQVNYKFKHIKSMVKLGGTNILNHYYKTAFGNPEVGAMYYVSLAYNIL